MFFSDKFIDEDNVDVAYLCEYLAKVNFFLPKGETETNRRYFQDKRSGEFVIGYKNCDSRAISKAFDAIYPQLGNNFAIAVIPPSKVSNNFQTASHKLCKLIIEQAQKDGKNITDASNCLRRKFDVDSKHLTPGRRNLDIEIESVEVIDRGRILNKNVLVLDDIVTTGNSMQAANILLEDAGAGKVKGLAIGKTVSKYSDPINTNLRYGFILDLDQTLFNTEHIKEYRDKRQWKKACDLARKCEVDIEIRKLIKYLRYDLGAEICIVTNSPKNYATILGAKLGIDERHIIAYHDCKYHKPDVEPYFRAKQIMEIYEACIVVVGDEENDLIPAQELGMTAVQASWYKKAERKFYNVEFQFTSIKNFFDNMKEVLEKADSFRSRV